MCGDKKKTDYRRSGAEAAERIVREVKKHEVRKKRQGEEEYIHEH